MSVEVRGGVRPMQDGRSVRVQHPRRLMTVQFTRQIARDTGVDSFERDGAEFELDALVIGSQCNCRRSSVTLVR